MSLPLIKDKNLASLPSTVPCSNGCIDTTTGEPWGAVDYTTEVDETNIEHRIFLCGWCIFLETEGDDIKGDGPCS